MRNPKIAVVVSGWHFPLHFYQAIENQTIKADLFCVAHRKPSQAKDKDISRLGNTQRENFDKILYKKIATEKDLKNWHYKLYPNTVGDWGCSNQWMEESDWRKYDLFLFTHDDNFILRNDFLEAAIKILEKFPKVEIISNSTGRPSGWLRGSCEFFTKSFIEKLGGKFDLSMTSLNREGKTDTPEDVYALNDWNATAYPLMDFIKKNDTKVVFISPDYRVSQFCIEGERGWIYRTHGSNTAYEDEGFKKLTHYNGAI
jgi:hypothetical protein